MNPTRNKKEIMKNSTIISSLSKTRAGIALVTRCWEVPAGGWPETIQAIQQASEVLHRGVTLKSAMDAVKDAGLVSHIHPSRA